jgi:hypothetical protein
MMQNDDATIEPNLRHILSDDVDQRDSERMKIAELAYQLWERRGGRGGSPEADWVEAQRQVRGQTTADKSPNS